MAERAKVMRPMMFAAVDRLLSCELSDMLVVIVAYGRC